MPVYEYQGQNYDIATDDPSEAKQKILNHLGTTTAESDRSTALQKFGQATASLADTGLNAVTGGLDYGAYNLARAAGLSPEQAQRETTSPKDVIGRAFGVANTPGYQNELSRRIMEGVGSATNAVANPIASATGLPQQDVNSMLQSGMMAASPYVPQAAGAVAQGVRTAAQGVGALAKGVAYDLPKGALRGMAYPEGTGANTALVPIKPTYYEHGAVNQFMKDQMPLSELQQHQLSSANLYQNKPVSNWAYGMAPENALGEKLVPAAGKFFEGVGENIGSGIRKNPLQGAVDLAGLYTGAGPVGSMIKSVPAMASGLLQKATNFEPGFAAKLKSAQNAQMQQTAATAAPITPPVAPAAPITPPVAPAAPITPPVAPAAPTTPPVGQLSPPTTPAQIQGANFIGNTEKKFGLTPVAPETITQKAQRVMGDNYRAPVSEQPITGPVAPAELPPPPATAAPVTTAEGPIAPEGMPAPVAETPKPLPTPAEAAIIAQKAKPVKATNLPTAERGTGKKKTAEEIPSTLPDLIELGKDKPLSAREAKKIISSAESLGKKYDIKYKTPDGIVRELTREVKFKPDPTITFNHIKMMPDDSVIATGIDTNGNNVNVNVDAAGKYTISRVDAYIAKKSK